MSHPRACTSGSIQHSWPLLPPSFSLGHPLRASQAHTPQLTKPREEVLRREEEWGEPRGLTIYTPGRPCPWQGDGGSGRCPPALCWCGVCMRILSTAPAGEQGFLTQPGICGQWVCPSGCWGSDGVGTRPGGREQSVLEAVRGGEGVPLAITEGEAGVVFGRWEKAQVCRRNSCGLNRVMEWGGKEAWGL